MGIPTNKGWSLLLEIVAAANMQEHGANPKIPLGESLYPFGYNRRGAWEFLTHSKKLSQVGNIAQVLL